MKPSKGGAVAVVEENGGYRECTLADFKDCPGKLVKGILKNLKGQADGKYEVDILREGNIFIRESVSLAETFLGIPVTVKFQNAIGKTVELVGVTNWNSDFDAEEIEVYTDDFDKETVHKSAIKKQIESWEVPQEQK